MNRTIQIGGKWFVQDQHSQLTGPYVCEQEAQAFINGVPDADLCPDCGGPAWVEHTGSIMPGIGVPCTCVEDAADLIALQPTKEQP